MTYSTVIQLLTHADKFTMYQSLIEDSTEDAITLPKTGWYHLHESLSSGYRLYRGNTWGTNFH